MTTQFAKIKTTFEALNKQRQSSEESLDQLTLDESPVTDSIRSSLVECLATAQSIVQELTTIEEKTQKLKAKAILTGTPKQLYNEDTAKSILEYAAEYESGVDAARSLLTRCQLAVDNLPAPAPRPVVVTAPTPTPTTTTTPTTAAATTTPPSSSLLLSSSSSSTSTSTTKDTVDTVMGTDTETEANAVATTKESDTQMEVNDNTVEGKDDMDTSADSEDDEAEQLALAMSMSAKPTLTKTSLPIKVVVKILRANVTVNIQTTADATIAELKAEIALASTEVDASTLLIIFKGKQLTDTDTLSSMGVGDGAMLFAGANPKSRQGSANTSPTRMTTTTPAPSNASSNATSAVTTTSSSERDILVAAVVAAITTMKAATDHPSLVAGVRTLKTLYGNVLKDAAKFGRVKAKNAILKQRLLSKPGGVAALTAAGFVHKQDDGEEVFLCETPNAHLAEIKAMLEEALASLQPN